MRRHAAVTSVTADAGTAQVVSLRHDVAIQTRRITAGDVSVGDANVCIDLVLVAHGGGREVQAPLSDDERARTFGHDSRNTRK